MIVDIMKEIAAESVADALSCELIFGKILQVSPLLVSIDQKITLSAQNCIVPKQIASTLSVSEAVIILVVKQYYIILGGA